MTSSASPCSSTITAKRRIARRRRAGQDIQDARRVAERLGVPHFVLDYETQFRKKVIDNFAQSYASGETPVPASPAINSSNLPISLKRPRTSAPTPWRQVITSRLARTDTAAAHCFARATRSAIRVIFFSQPRGSSCACFVFRLAGGYAKAQVRELAREFGLTVADKADSQDICFVPSGRYSDIVERLAPGAAVPGEIVHIDGRVLGRHAGVIHYTIGQRRGLGLGAAVAGRAAEPLFVIRLDAANAQVIVGPREALEMRGIELRDVNWIGEGSIEDIDPMGIPIFARVRSTRPPALATLWAGERRRRRRWSSRRASLECRRVRLVSSMTAKEMRLACLAAGILQARRPQSM